MATSKCVHYLRQVFITIRVFQLDSPFKTGVGDFSVTQRAMISSKDPSFRQERCQFVKNMGGEQLTLINNGSLSRTHLQSSTG